MGKLSKSSSGKTSRRTFLQDTAKASVIYASPSLFTFADQNGISKSYEGLKSSDYLAKVKIETWIEEKEIFTEGPAMDNMGDIYFTNIPTRSILRWSPFDREISRIKMSTDRANGLRFNREGDLLVCEGGSGKVIKIDIKTEEKTILAEKYLDKKLQSPNDLDFDLKGRIYFSSRSNNPDLNEYNARAVYRCDPDGKVHQLLTEPEIHMPNGIVVAPDDRTIYIIEAHPDKDRNRKILAFDLGEDGSISNKRTVIDFYPGRSGDGMCIDREGNLYVAAGLHKRRNTSETLDTRPGIHVINPQGQLVAYRETPIDTITNCTFGGKDLRTLYITCGAYLLKVRTKIPGKENYRPAQ